MSKISKKSKIVLFSLLTITIVIVLSFAMFLLCMFLGSYNRLNWTDMIGNESEWISDDEEIVFQRYEPDNYEFNSNDLESVFSYYGLKYKGKINDREVLVYFGAIEINNKTIGFHDSESNELLVKADVKSYSGEKFKMKVTEDNIGLSKDKYTFTTKQK